MTEVAATDTGVEDSHLVLTKLRQFSFQDTSLVTRVCISPDSQILAVSVSSEDRSSQELFLLYHASPDPTASLAPSEPPASMKSLAVCSAHSHLWLTPSGPGSWCRDRNILVVLTAPGPDASLLWIEVSAGSDQGLSLLTLSALSFPDLRTLISEDKRSAPILSADSLSVGQLEIRLVDCKHDEVLLIADPSIILLVSVSSEETDPPSQTSPLLSTLLPLRPHAPPAAAGTLSGVCIRGPILLLLYSAGAISLYRLPSGRSIGALSLSDYLQCCVSEEADPGEADSLAPPYLCFSAHPHLEYIAVANRDNYVIVLYLRRYLALFPSHLNLALAGRQAPPGAEGQAAPATGEREESLLRECRGQTRLCESPLWRRRLGRLKGTHPAPAPPPETRLTPPLDSSREQNPPDNPFSSNFSHEIPSPPCLGCTWFSSPPAASGLRVLSISCDSSSVALHYSSADVTLSHISVFSLATGARHSAALSPPALPIHTHSHGSDRLLLLLQAGWEVCPVAGLSRQALLAGTLAHCDAAAAELLCQHNGWEQSLLPLSVLREALAHRQLDSVCFYLRMRRTRDGELELVGGTGEERNGLPMSLESIKLTIETLYGALRGASKDAYEAQFSSQVLHLSHKFLLFLLVRLCASTGGQQEDCLARELARFRQFMQTDSATPGLGEGTEFPPALLAAPEPPTPVEWRHMRKSDIIRDALDKQSLPLAQGYLLSRLEEQEQPLDRTRRSAEISWGGVRQLVLHLAYQCLEREDLSKCEQRLSVVGPSVPAMLCHLATHTTSRSVRASLFGELRARGDLDAEQQRLFEFLQALEHTYASQSHKQTLSFLKKLYKGAPGPEDFPALPAFRGQPPVSVLSELWRSGELQELCPEFFGASKPLLPAMPPGRRDGHYFAASASWLRGLGPHRRDLLLMEGFYLKREQRSEQCRLLLPPHALALLYTSSQLGLRAAREAVSLPSSDSAELLLETAAGATRATRRLLRRALSSAGLSPRPPVDSPALLAVIFREASEGPLLLSRTPSLRGAGPAPEGLLIELCRYAAREGCASFLSLSLADLSAGCELPVQRFLSRVSQEGEEQIRVPVWIQMLVLSKQLTALDSRDPAFSATLFQYSLSNARYVLEQPGLKLPDTFHLFKPLIPLATLVYAPVPLEETVGGSAEYSVPRETLLSALQPYPKLLSALFPSEPGSLFSPPLQEVTVYELLHGSVPFNLRQLFSWQSTNCLGEKGDMEHSRSSFPSAHHTEFPHFSNAGFSHAHGYSQKLDYIHYLNKGNPAFAYANLLASDPQIESKYCSRRMKAICQRVYRLGLSQYGAPKVSSSCAALMEMLGWDSAPFRTDVVLLNLLLQYEGHAVQIKQHAAALTDSLSPAGSQEGASALSRYAEELFGGFMLSGELMLDNFAAAEIWAVLESFCQYHQLPPTRSYLQRCAAASLWPQLLSYAQMWSTPPKLLLEILREHFCDSDVKEHLETAILVMMEGKPPFPEQGKRRPYQKLSSRGSSAPAEGRAVKRSLSREPQKPEPAPPPEVFELLPLDRSSRLNRSDNLFELVCASQSCSHPTARTLLAFAVSLRRDLLPLVATCFIPTAAGAGEEPSVGETATLLDCLCVWLFCRLHGSPELRKAVLSLGLVPRTEELSLAPLHQSSSLQWHQWGLRDLEQVCVCLSSNMPAHGIVMKQAFRFFDFENPYVHFLRFVETYALHSFDQSQKQLESFLTCLKKLCSGEQQYPKSSLGSPKWVSDLSTLCLLQMLAHPITPWHHLSLLTAVIRALDRVQQPYKLPKDGSYDPSLHSGFTAYPVPLGDLLNTQRLSRLLSLLQPMEKVPIEITCRCTLPLLPDTPTSSWLNSLTCSLSSSLSPGQLLSQLVQLGLTEVVQPLCEILHLYPTKAVLSSFELRHQRLTKSSWWRVLQNRTEFWLDCNATLQSIEGDIGLVAEFFERTAADCQTEGEERSLYSDAILLRQLALDWHLRCPELDTDKILSLKKMLWLSRLEWIISGTDPSVCIDDILKTTSRSHDAIGFHDLSQLTLAPPHLLTPSESPELSQELRDALSLILGLLLDANLVASALQLADLFSHRPHNIVIVCSCIALAQKLIEPAQVDASLLALLSPGDSEIGAVPPAECVQLFRVLLEQSAAPGLRGGARCLERVLSLLQVSQGLVMSYGTAASEATRTSLLTILTSDQLTQKLQLALPFVRCCCADPARLARFLERCLYITLCRHFRHGYDQEPDDPVFVRPVFDVDAKCEAFSELTRICDESELGRLLLQRASKDVQIAQAGKAEPRLSLLQVSIELLVRAETCLSNACQLDLISSLINSTLALAKLLTLRQCWSLLARLLTGIGRFHELSAILEIFVNHEQLEYLLKKGLEKEELLKTALLKFLVKHHENDIDKLTIVAMRFNLYRGLGETCVKQAKLLLRKLTHDYPKLEDFPDVKERVREICKLFCNAATYYSREDCYMQASECKQQARLMSAQYRLLPYNIIVIGLSKVGIRAILAGPSKHMLFQEVLIVADAYGLNNPRSWGDILYGRCVRNKNVTFFSSYSSRFPFNSIVYKHLVNRLTTENPRNAEYRDNLTSILTTIPDMTIENRLCKDLLGSIPCPAKFHTSLSQEVIYELQSL